MIGVLERLMGAPMAAANYGPADDYWYMPMAPTSGAGVTVTPETALQVSTVFACVRVIAEDLGSIPLQMFRRLQPTGKERVGYGELPLARKLGLQPNRWQSSMEWREMMTGHVLLRGNCYSKIEPGPSGFADQLVPLNPERMKVSRLPSGDLVYTYKLPDTLEEVKYSQAEIFHVPGLSFDGLTGVSPISLAREEIGSAIAARRYNSLFYGKGMSAAGILQHPGRLSTEAKTNLSESFIAKYGGIENAYKPIVLEEGMEWKQLGMSAEDAQHLQQEQYTDLQIAQRFRVPPHKIGILDRATWNNIESQSIAYVTDTLRPWAVRWEQRILLSLIIRSDLYFAEFNMEGLLRGDIKSRNEAYQIARQNGWINADEIRERENMNPIPNGQGQEYWRPGNMVFADTEPSSVAQQSGAPKAAVTNPRLRLLATEVATRLVRKEVDRVTAAAKRYAADADGWDTWCADFYAEHGAEIARTLHVPDEAGRAYADAQLLDLRSVGVAAVESWSESRPPQLAELALEDVDRKPVRTTRRTVERDTDKRIAVVVEEEFE